jgi:hypothetical protein
MNRRILEAVCESKTQKVNRVKITDQNRRNIYWFTSKMELEAESEIIDLH